MVNGWVRFRRGGLVAALAILMGGGCSSEPLAPGDELSMSMMSAHFLYMWSPGDEAPDSVYQERHFAWVTAQLGLVPMALLEYHKLN